MIVTPARPVATRLHVGRILTVGILVVGVGMGGAIWLLSQQRAKAKAALPGGESATTPGYVASQLHYQAEAAPPPPPPPPPPVDLIGPKLAAMLAKMQEMQAKLDELDKRKATNTTTIVQPPVAKPVAMQKPVGPASFFVAHEVKDVAVVSKERLYTLAPGDTKLPCQVETVINSDVEGYFTAKVSTNVYDTATRRHLLVPQGSTILGNDQSRSLIYGNERMDTISLTLTLPDGHTVDLGRAPVTDQLGVAGLTGTVDHHYLRLFGAVFIGGALKGGISAMQTALTTASGAGQVASGISSVGNQATSTVIQPYINTRPTIIVSSGQLCTVLIIKELKLAAQWE